MLELDEQAARALRRVGAEHDEEVRELVDGDAQVRRREVRPLVAQAAATGPEDGQTMPEVRVEAGCAYDSINFAQRSILGHDAFWHNTRDGVEDRLDVRRRQALEEAWTRRETLAQRWEAGDEAIGQLGAGGQAFAHDLLQASRCGMLERRVGEGQPEVCLRLLLDGLAEVKVELRIVQPLLHLVAREGAVLCIARPRSKLPVAEPRRDPVTAADVVVQLRDVRLHGRHDLDAG